jgi:hypothetical protein
MSGDRSELSTLSQHSVTWSISEARTRSSSGAVRMLARILALLAFLLIGDTLALAQTYSIDWHTIDGGGGTSTGGTYQVTGTIGQPDAGLMSGGSYTVQGGFWGIISVVQTPGAPMLAIFRTATNTAVVSWPSPSTGWTLQVNTNNLASVNWSNVTSNIQDDGITKFLIVNPSTGNRYYRLKQ